MWIPSSFEELLNERIEFAKNYLKTVKNINLHHDSYSAFTKALIDYEYCLSLMALVKHGKPKFIDKVNFKKLAFKIIFDVMYGIDRSEHKCIHLYGTSFVLKDEEDYLPQQQKDNNAAMKVALKMIFEEVDNM